MSSEIQQYQGPLTERGPHDRYGNPGHILYKPLDEEHLGDGNEWHLSGRWTNAKPAFAQLGDFNEWHYPTKPDSDTAFPNHLRPVRAQQRWLYNQVPEAAGALDEIGPLLAQDHVEPVTAKEPLTRQPLMAMGYIEGYKQVDGREVLIMATATGKAGEILRLNCLVNTPRQWENEDNVTLKVHSGIAEETLWREHCSPISNVKFVIARGRKGKMRLILAQQPAATTIFKPIIHKMPVDGQGMLPGQRPSYIEMNPICTLRPEKTGGSPHTDVAFSPGADFKDPQIAVIDEGGHWSVWDMRFFKRMYRPYFRACGHFQTGLLPRPPERGTSTGDKYKLIWVSRMSSLPPFGGETSIPSSSEALFTGPRDEDLSAHCLLICDNTSIKVVDIRKRELSLPMTTSCGPLRDRILDLKACPLGTSLALVLTERTLRLIDALPISNTDRVDKMTLRTLLSIPHGRVKDDTLLLGIAPDTQMMHSAGFVLVYIYSTKNTCVDFIWIRVVMSEPRSAQFHRLSHTLSNNGLYQGANGGGFRSLALQPIRYKSRSKRNRPGGPGTQYFRDGVQFYDIIAQDQRLAVRHGVASVFSAESSAIVVAPNINSFKSARRYLRHKDVFRYTAETFVTPDSFAIFDVTGLRTEHRLVEHILEEEDREKQPRDITKLLPQYKHLFEAQEYFEEEPSDAPAGWTSSSPMATILANLGDFTEQLSSRIPFTTLREIAWRFNVNKSIKEYAWEWNATLDGFRQDSSLVTLSPLDTLQNHPSLETIYQSLACVYLNVRPHVPHDTNQRHANDMAEQATREAACDIMLSSFTLIETQLIPPPPETQEANPHLSLSHENQKQPDAMDIDSHLHGHPRNLLSSQQTLPTPRTTPSLHSTPTPEPSNPSFDADDALSRVRSLVTSCDDATTIRHHHPQSKLLSKWTRLDEDTTDYVWRRGEDEEWMLQLKARKERDEARKRKRADRYKALGLGGGSSVGVGMGTDMLAPSSQPVRLGRPGGDGGGGVPVQMGGVSSQGYTTRHGGEESSQMVMGGLGGRGLGMSMSQPVGRGFEGAKKWKGKKRARGF